MTERVRIMFESDTGVETLWARAIEGDRYRIDNVPFSTPSVSLGDVVEARSDSSGLHFEALYAKSGERTLWITVHEGFASPTGEWLLAHLALLGCAHEAATQTFLAVSVPALVDLDELSIELLTRGPSQVSFDDADPNRMHPLPAAPGSPAVAQLAALDAHLAEEFQKLLALAALSPEELDR